jgi:predicted nucleotidyltransferase component of viral defense system
MKTLRVRIHDAARRYGVPQHTIERDYAISYLLLGVASQPALKGTLVLKGGTALRKLFFGDYRFSEDLDFSTQNAPIGDALEDALSAVVDEALRRLRAYGPFSIEFERYVEREPHPHGQEAFTIRVQFPWHPTPLCRLRAEITHDEPVLMGPDKRRLIHGYEDEDLQAEVYVYRLEEMVAEKLRTLLQTRQKLLSRGWGRLPARDYYDLWRILDTFGESLERQQFVPLLTAKCEHRGVSFLELDDFFSEELVAHACDRWDASLSPFVADLPDCQDVLDRLRLLLRPLFGFKS